MKIIHVTYTRARRRYTDPWAWIKFLDFYTGVLESLARYAQVIAIYHIHYSGVVQHNGVSYHFPACRNWELVIPIRFNRYICKLDPDVVVVHGLIFPWQVLMLRWQLGDHVGIIAQHHAELPFRDARKFFQLCADRHIKAYLFCSFDLGLPWLKKGQIRDEKKIKVIMETSSAFSPLPKQHARQFTGIEGQKVYLWVGRLNANKDPLLVVKAFISFAGANPEARLYLIFQTDELLNALKTLLSESPGANEVIRLVGKVDHADLEYWYNSADFIVSGSHYEGGGIAVCEGLSCGCIPVLTDIPSFRMMTDHGRIGLLYPQGDESALVEELKKTVALDTEVEKRKVVEWFKKELSVDAIADKMIKVINEVNRSS